MSGTFRTINKFLLLLGSLLLVSACNQSQFTAATTTASNTSGSVQVSPPAVNPPDSDPTTPTTPTTPTDPCVPLAAQTRLTKIMFLVDTSESNYGFFGDGTDPKKHFRLGSIQTFFDHYNSNSNIQWGFMTFAGTSAKDFIGKNGQNSFTNSVSVMQSALDRFSKASDDGNTPYLAALSSATKSVAGDADLKSSANPQYYVIFLSDGFPTDINNAGDVKNSIAKLLATDSGNITLSTVFYGHKNESDASDAVSMLSSMAQMGQGKFANAADPQSIIDIVSLIPIPNQCPQ